MKPVWYKIQKVVPTLGIVKHDVIDAGVNYYICQDLSGGYILLKGLLGYVAQRNLRMLQLKFS